MDDSQLHPQLEEYLGGQVKVALEAKIGTTLSSVMNKVIGPFRSDMGNTAIEDSIDIWFFGGIDNWLDISEKYTQCGLFLTYHVDIEMHQLSYSIVVIGLMKCIETCQFSFVNIVNEVKKTFDIANVR